MLILLAHDELLWIYKEKTAEAKLMAIGAAQSLLEQAANLHQPTKGYYWVLAACSQRMGDLTEGEVRAHHDAEALRLRARADETPAQNAAELFYISRDRRFGCASAHVRPAFRRPFAEGGVLAAYREMLRIEPQYYNALFFTGLQYGNIEENHEAAIAMYSVCLALWPRDSSALCNRAQSLAELGRHKESLVDAARSVEIAREMLASDETSTVLLSKLAGALLLQSGCLARSGDTNAARTTMDEAKALWDGLAREYPADFSTIGALETKLLAEVEKLIDESAHPSEDEPAATPEAVQQQEVNEEVDAESPSTPEVSR
jgi:tetratricopeptide (TPR) repeat protein